MNDPKAEPKQVFWNYNCKKAKVTFLDNKKQAFEENPKLSLKSATEMFDFSISLVV